MKKLNLHIGNATGELDHLVPVIQKCFKVAKKNAEANFNSYACDIFIVNTSYGTIPQYGFGGFTPSASVIYINVDKRKNQLEEKLLIGTILHEIHHAVRWQEINFGETLCEAIVAEGLACLFEYQVTGHTPIYAKTDVSSKIKNRLLKSLNDSDYDHNLWFYGGRNMPKWVGYTIGFDICKAVLEMKSLSASKSVHMNSKEFLNAIEEYLK